MKRYEKYKKVDLPWLKKVPEHWEMASVHSYFDNEIEKNKDFVFKNAFKFKYGTLIYKNEIGDIKEYQDTYVNYSIVKKNDIVINGLNLNYDFISKRVALCPKSGIITSAYVVLRPRENTNSKYYLYLLKGLDSQKIFHGMGTGIRLTLGYNELKRMSILVPPKSEQEKIAAFLDYKISRIDKAIELEEKKKEEIKNLKQSIISDAVTKGLDPDVPMKDSGVDWIGEIPEHWEVCRIKHVSSLVTDGAHVSPDIKNGKYFFVSTVNLKNRKINFDDALKTSEQSYRQLVKNGCKPIKNDVLISKDGTLGKTTTIDYDKDFVVASSLVIIRPILNKIIPYYLEYYLQGSNVQEYLNMLVAGSTLRRVSISKNANIYIVFPETIEQQQIVSYLDKKTSEIDTYLSKIDQKIEKLKSLKQSLISEVVTGQIDVRDFEIPKEV